MRTLAVLLILAQAFPTEVGKRSPRLQRPSDIVALVDQAHSLPSEFRADTLLRLATSSLITEGSWKQKLIEEAFWSASSASLPYMQRVTNSSDLVLTNEIRANRLEALTLRARAVQEMLQLDLRRGRYLFEQIPQITLPKLDCSSAVTPDLVDYYQAAVNVFEKSFTLKQRRDGDDINLLRQVIADVESPAQVPPALEMIFAVKTKPTQRGELIGAFATNLQEVSGSDREYGAVEKALVSAIPSGQLRASEAAVLLPALRSYIVKYLNGRRCADNVPATGVMPKSAADFDDLAAKFDPAGLRYKEISLDETKPAGKNSTDQQSPPKQSEQAETVLDALRWLTHGGRVRNGEVLRWTPQERTSQDWLDHYDDAVKLVQDLNESDEPSPEAFFCLKSDALNLLATLPPPGPARDRAMEEYRQFLEEYYPSIQNRNLWFTMFRHMLYTARFSDDPKYKDWILNQLAESSNPIISLYAKLEGRIGPPKETYPVSHVKAALRAESHGPIRIARRKTSTPARLLPVTFVATAHPKAFFPMQASVPSAFPI